MFKVNFEEGAKKLYGVIRKSEHVFLGAGPRLRLQLAHRFLDHVHKKLKSGGLKLEPLSPLTIAAKKAKKMPRPKKPMYGYGDTKDNSLYSLIGIRVGLSKVSVGPAPFKRHYSKKTGRQLLLTHAKGSEKLPVRTPMKNAMASFRLRAHVRALKIPSYFKGVGK